MKKNKINVSSIILVLIFIAGLSLLLYPSIASWWNYQHATHAIDTYDQTIQILTGNDYKEIFDAADKYNQRLLKQGNRFYPNELEHQEYMNQLSVSGTPMIGFIDIPLVKISLPIYHGTTEEVLSNGVGHIEGTSLPVGGLSTHAVLSGHRGLPSAKMFDDIVKLVEGDTFSVTVLDRTFTYEIDSIRTVLPNEIENISIEDGRDLCTLVTCTPYGINTHRILITGHRIENLPADYNGRAEAILFDSKLVALFIAVPILIILFIYLMVHYRKRSGEG